MVGDSFESMKTVSAFKPLLAEAAAEFMFGDYYKFKGAQALKRALEGFSIHQGDRGDLLVLLLCVARDMAICGNLPQRDM